MKVSRIHVVAAAGLGAAALILGRSVPAAQHFDAGTSVPATTAAPQPSDGDYLAMHIELAHLRASLAEVRRDVIEANTARDRSAIGQDQEPEPSGASREGTAAVLDPYDGLDPVERDWAIADDLDAFLNAEEVDADWSAETEAQASDAIAEDPGATLISLRCRSTLCSAEIAYRSTDEREQAMDRLTRTPPFSTSGFVHMRDSDPPESALYFTRQGHELPRPR
ncbi:MAG: hypothetical protein Tsb0020_01580 [Haliangiales bacterium]